MIPNKLPPRGIFVPTYLIFHADLPPATLRTWIQLRCLAWSGWSTPPLTISEIASQLGIHTTRLSRHLAQLTDDSALSCRLAGQGKIIITFPDQPTFMPESDNITPDNLGDTSANSDERISILSSSYFPKRILGYLSYEEDEEDLLMIKEIRSKPSQNPSNLTAFSSKKPALITR